jgi:DNA-binding NarL/FixJ family response regulator
VALLRAYVEIMLAVDDREAARDACDELDQLAEADDDGALGAIAAQARGALQLAEGDARAAAATLRRAGEAWRRLDAPYELARTRALAAQACRALGDDDSAALELDAARAGFERLGARPELERLERLAARGHSGAAHGLTARELEVLRHVAAGATNKAIATELVLSVRTIDRHVSNILTKLGVSTRAAAAARAHELSLL